MTVRVVSRKCQDGGFCQIDMSCSLLAGVSGVLMARRIEIESPIVVLLTMWRAGAPSMNLNGTSRLNIISLGAL